MPERLRDCGLFTERGERFAGMVVVPDASGGLVRWLVGRAIDPDRTPRFPGASRLQAGAWAWASRPRAALRGRGRGGLRLACPCAAGASPAVAALGTQGVEKVAEGLRGCPRVFLAFDSDDAGLEATERLAGLLGRRARRRHPSPGRRRRGRACDPSPTAAPSSSACWLRRHAPPASGFFPASHSPRTTSPLPELDPLRPCLRDSLPLHPIPTLTAQEDLCPIHDGPCPRTASRRGVRTGHSLQETTPQEGDRHGEQERKQQRRPQGHRHSRQERQRGAQRPRHHRRARAALGTGCRPQSPTPWGSPSTPRWSPSARGAEAGSSTTSKATPSSTRQNRIFGYGGVGAMSWLGT